MHQVQDRNPSYESNETTTATDTTLKSRANEKKKDPRSKNVDQLDDYDYMGNHDDYDYMGH